MAGRPQKIDGLPVYDAQEPLIIEIIPGDIHKRDRRNPGKCAVATACKRELHVTEALAYRARLYVRHGDHWKRYLLPDTVRAEVIAFDRGGGFSPGTYRIPILTPSKRAGSPHQGGNTGATGTGRKRQTYRRVEGVRAQSPLMGGGSY